MPPVDPALPTVEATAPLTVVVADDHPMWLDALTRDLEHAGMRVVATAADGPATVRRVVATRPAVLVLDLNLPGMRGDEVCRAIGDVPTRVLVLSASGEQQDVLAAVKAGIETKELPKPATDEPGRPGNAALSELLRVLLKAKSDETGVAPKLIASASDLDAIASGSRNLPALSGWRAEVFGNDALRLANGEIALSAKDGVVRVVPVAG